MKPETLMPESEVPHRQIRASYDSHTITLYQAFRPEVAIPAVEEQRLDASPKFFSTRFTWVKPSWCSTMFYSGYTYKDPQRAHILALTMTRENFVKLLSDAVERSNGREPTSDEVKAKDVRVQWDPERNRRLQVLPYRSIQIGISGETGTKWVEEWIEKIEDVTERAKELKLAVDQGTPFYDLVDRGLMPVETEYEVSEELRQILKMDVDDGTT